MLLFSQGTDLFLRYDVALGTFSPIRSTQSVYGPLRVDATGARITLGLDVFDGNLDFLRRVAAIYGGEAIPGSALSRDGNYLYQALGYARSPRPSISIGVSVKSIAGGNAAIHARIAARPSAMPAFGGMSAAFSV